MAESARETSIRVRDGLLLLEERERGRPETLIEELEAEATVTLDRVETIVDGMARQERVWLAHGMNDVVADANAVVPGTFSRLRWKAIKEMFDSFKTWVRTPLPGCGFSPVAIMSWRGNPPESAPVEPEEPPAIVVVGEVEDVIVQDETKSKGRSRK